MPCETMCYLLSFIGSQPVTVQGTYSGYELLRPGNGIPRKTQKLPVGS